MSALTTLIDARITNLAMIVMAPNLGTALGTSRIPVDVRITSTRMTTTAWNLDMSRTIIVAPAHLVTGISRELPDSLSYKSNSLSYKSNSRSRKADNFSSNSDSFNSKTDSLG
jgi:hypothetical protein